MQQNQPIFDDSAETVYLSQPSRTFIKDYGLAIAIYIIYIIIIIIIFLFFNYYIK